MASAEVPFAEREMIAPDFNAVTRLAAEAAYEMAAARAWAAPA